MLATAEPCRMLIEDWTASVQIEEVRETALLVEEEKDTVKTYYDGNYSIKHGIYYQRCGGGRRIIRKRIGSN